jgi:hypothetical protein
VRPHTAPRGGRHADMPREAAGGGVGSSCVRQVACNMGCAAGGLSVCRIYVCWCCVVSSCGTICIGCVTFVQEFWVVVCVGLGIQVGQCVSGVDDPTDAAVGWVRGAAMMYHECMCAWYGTSMVAWQLCVLCGEVSAEQMQPMLGCHDIVSKHAASFV